MWLLPAARSRRVISQESAHGSPFVFRLRIEIGFLAFGEQAFDAAAQLLSFLQDGISIIGGADPVVHFQHSIGDLGGLLSAKWAYDIFKGGDSIG